MNQSKDEGELVMQEVETCEAMRKVLFIDIPGVLNTSKSPYNFVNFDKDKVARLKDIVSKTHCQVVLSPTMPMDKGLLAHARREIDCIANLLSAVLPEWEVCWTYDIGIAVAMFANKENPITSFAVVRCRDTPELEWQLTFPTRCVKVASGDGLTDEKASEVVRILNTEIKEDEIPLKTMTKQEVATFARNRFAPMKQITNRANAMIDEMMAKRGIEFGSIDYWKHWNECRVEVGKMLEKEQAELTCAHP